MNLTVQVVGVIYTCSNFRYLACLLHMCHIKYALKCIVKIISLPPDLFYVIFIFSIYKKYLRGSCFKVKYIISLTSLAVLYL